MPSVTDEPKMWTSYEHDHGRPHVWGGLKKKQLPHRKSGAGADDDDDDVCPPVKDRLIQACHRPLISPTYISSLAQTEIYLEEEEEFQVVGKKMAGNNPRKFKDRIALLNQKQAESTEQFEVRDSSFSISWKNLNLTIYLN